MPLPGRLVTTSSAGLPKRLRPLSQLRRAALMASSWLLFSGRSVFELSVSGWPAASKAEGGREKTKTKNRGGPGPQLSRPARVQPAGRGRGVGTDETSHTPSPQRTSRDHQTALCSHCARLTSHNSAPSSPPLTARCIWLHCSRRQLDRHLGRAALCGWRWR